MINQQIRYFVERLGDSVGIRLGFCHPCILKGTELAYQIVQLNHGVGVVYII